MNVALYRLKNHHHVPSKQAPPPPPHTTTVEEFFEEEEDTFEEDAFELDLVRKDYRNALVELIAVRRLKELTASARASLLDALQVGLVFFLLAFFLSMCYLFTLK
jgi:hypothetical protein